VDVVRTKTDLRSALAARRGRGDTRGGRAAIGFVPTMGALHEGHLALVDVARQRAATVVMSIFVNPLQFGPREDFAAYPRPLERDLALAESRGVDVVFAPGVDEMYPTPSLVSVVPVGSVDRPALDSRWEGATRPGHFAGVLTVVAKLFLIVQPDVAAFGQKDLQQVTLVRAMVRDLDFPIEIVVVPTVRDPDGLALSSRNVYLSPQERQQAVAIPKALQDMLQAWRGGVGEANALLNIGRDVLAREPSIAVDYLAVAEPQRLEPVVHVESGAVAMIAARVGRTRLIDNVRFERGT
jgi:pantoate--beta-alanine ligase